MVKALADAKMEKVFGKVLLGSLKEEQEGVDEEWANIRDGISAAAAAVAKKIPKVARKPWLSDETFVLVEEKQKAYMQWQQKRSDESLRRKYQDLRNQVTGAIKGDRNQC